MGKTRRIQQSVFEGRGFEPVLATAVEEAAELYLSDQVPWVVGYSGGKDSTAVLEIVWLALQKIGADRAKKPVHVISTDTLVENPIVAAWVGNSLERMRERAEAEGLPISSYRLTPKIENSFWVNLIGRGYPAPRHKFRWCTERLKIDPAHTFISATVDRYGEVILVLGTRKAESAARAQSMTRHEKHRIRDRLSPNASLPNSSIYTPIEDWTNDDVWLFLIDQPNPWGGDNMELFQMYRGASPDGECPLVVDTDTPSCGDSRFGCWVCTLVEKDKSMQAMIHNDEEKSWMAPLLAIRNEIDFRNMPEGGDRHLRDFRRMNGKIQMFHDRTIPGPYTRKTRERLLDKILRTERLIRRTGPTIVHEMNLIQIEELEEIRRIWIMEKHEIEDRLPTIYKEATGEDYPGVKCFDDATVLGQDELDVLASLCGDSDRLHYQMLRELLAIEQQQHSALRRGGIFKKLEKAIERNFYDDEKDAVKWAQARSQIQHRRSPTDPTPSG